MRTLIASDLHLGLPSGRDVLRASPARAALVERLAAADRVVLLGDLVELLGTRADLALACVDPLLASVAAALGPDREVIVVPGNHDRPLVEPWLRERARPLGLEEDVPASSSGELAHIVAALAGTRVRVAYPGVWLRDDVYATHGHYLDAHLKPPPPLRLLWPRWDEWLAPPPPGPAGPSDYERALAWAYDGIARQGQSRHSLDGGFVDRARRVLTFVGSALLPRAGDGSAEVGLGLMAAKLRTGGLPAMAATVERLAIDAEHVVFGHVHRAGPLVGDDPARWRTKGGAHLHNPGAWIATGLVRDPDSPYAPGRCIELRDGGPPALVRLLE
jgi:hypothetical protein